MTWNTETKEKINYALAAIMMLFGVGMTIAGFCVPPLGEIGVGVLTVLGQALTFAGALLGISLHYSNELTIFKKEVEKEMKDKDNM